MHLPRRVRERFGVDTSLFSLTGRLILADLGSARKLAEAMAREVAQSAPELALALTPGRLYTAGLVHEIFHGLIERYRQEVDAEVLEEALEALTAEVGADRLEEALQRFAREFPPPAVWQGEVSEEAFLAGATGGRSHRSLLLEEMLLLWLAHATPAFASFREIFDDGPLRRETAYPEIIGALAAFLAAREPFPEIPSPDGSGAAFGGSDLLSTLRSREVTEAASMRDLLEALRPALPELVLAAYGEAPSAESRTAAKRRRSERDDREARGAEGPAGDGAPPDGRLDTGLGARALRGFDLLREEERPVFPPGPGPVEMAVRHFSENEPEAFSDDRDWMPTVVMVAKNVYVWLDQLARRHGRSITRLDQVPDAELDTLADRGFTALWLIGLWERSRASREIKRRTGNPEAEASAYSLASYTVAAAFGGEEALEDLQRRALARGIRLACDMVPNHFGIDSDWVLDHPERFLQLPAPPFPSYSFTGPDLSPRPEEVGIYLEDHYYDRSDAAVVFQRVDRTSGEIAYVYHGNDGTSTPWNDTAQLDYLQPEVREAITEVILGVARRFPIIRFDAAMTLARRHVRRLWYPAPGEGGAVPSRAEHGLPPALFDREHPDEFWRTVVDRAAEETPDTLLLAEAFWLMESYFVRTLGMHRVYNSAFMNMLRDERNGEYRRSIQEMLTFDPRILQRHVNFMSNPDERTAVDQFGAREKYFAVATLLATLPGLPMFGHGQVEGLAERYGMEYRRAYHAEQADAHLVARHARQVAPLLRRRAIFAGAEHFRLYDFLTPEGKVDENVFAFSNAREWEPAAVALGAAASPDAEGAAEASGTGDESGAESGADPSGAPSSTGGAAGDESGADPSGAPSSTGGAAGDESGAASDTASEGPPGQEGPARPEGGPEGGEPATGPFGQRLDGRSLVVVHNAAGHTRGRIRRAFPVARLPAEGAPEESAASKARPRLVWTTLGAALGLDGRARLLRCRDAATDLEHVFTAEEITGPGLPFRLGPYEHHAFVDFRPIPDESAPAGGASLAEWRTLARALDGRGVPSLEEALLEPRLQPLLDRFRALLDFEHFDRLSTLVPYETSTLELLDEVERRHAAFAAALRRHLAGDDPAGDLRGGEEPEAQDSPADRALARSLRRDLERALLLAALPVSLPPRDGAAGKAPDTETEGDAENEAEDDAREQAAEVGESTGALHEPPWLSLAGDRTAWGVLYAWLLVRRLGRLAPGSAPSSAAGGEDGAGEGEASADGPRAWLDDLLLARPIAEAFRSLGLPDDAVRDAVLSVKCLTAGRRPPLGPASEETAAGTPNSEGDLLAAELSRWAWQPDVRARLRVHLHEGVPYLHRESLEELLARWVTATALDEGPSSPGATAALTRARALADHARRAGYRLAEQPSPEPGDLA